MGVGEHVGLSGNLTLSTSSCYAGPLPESRNVDFATRRGVNDGTVGAQNPQPCPLRRLEYEKRPEVRGKRPTPTLLWSSGALAAASWA